MAYDIPSISDLEAIQLLNKHYAEVITSKKDGVSSAADITRTTNPITGVTRRTLYKILDDMDDTFLERLLKMAFTPVGTFTAGATLTDARQTLLWEVSQGGDGHYYSWSGTFPKAVTAGSSPSPIEAGSWVDRTDDSLRNEIRETVFQNMKRLAAEAGYNLVDGSFEEGANISGWPDVVWCQTDGKYYQWHLDEAKTIAAGSAPTNIGIDWIDKSGIYLRDELSEQDILSNIKSTSSVESLIESSISSTGRAALQYGTDYPTTSPMNLSTMGALLDGGKVNANFQANNNSDSKTKITKSGTSTAVVTTTTGTSNVDCVAYVEFAENSYNSKDYYQTALTIENLGLFNTSVTSLAEALHIEQAGGLRLKNVLLNSVGGVALKANDLWSTELDSCIFDGAYIQNAGTSMTFTNCHAVDNDNVIAGAYQWDNVKYSSLINCTADKLTYPVYKMHDCHGITLTSCGSEKITVGGATTGIVFDSSGYNEVTFLEYNHVNNSTDTSPTFAFAEGDNIKMIGGRANLALGTRTNPDIHIKGANCYVEVHGFIFRDQTIPGLDSIPSVTFAPAATNSKVVVYLQSGRVCVITKSGTTYQTIGHDVKTFTPYLQSGSTNDFTYSLQSGRCSRSGDMITVNGEITITGNSAQTGQINIGGLPYLSKYKANATFWCNNADVTMSGYLPASAKNIFLFKTSTANTKTELRPADMTSSATITFTISYVWDTTAVPVFS